MPDLDGVILIMATLTMDGDIHITDGVIHTMVGDIRAMAGAAIIQVVDTQDMVMAMPMRHLMLIIIAEEALPMVAVTTTIQIELLLILTELPLTQELELVLPEETVYITVFTTEAVSTVQQIELHHRLQTETVTLHREITAQINPDLTLLRDDILPLVATTNDLAIHLATTATEAVEAIHLAVVLLECQAVADTVAVVDIVAAAVVEPECLAEAEDKEYPNLN